MMGWLGCVHKAVEVPAHVESIPAERAREARSVVNLNMSRMFSSVDAANLRERLHDTNHRVPYLLCYAIHHSTDSYRMQASADPGDHSK